MSQQPTKPTSPPLPPELLPPCPPKGGSGARSCGPTVESEFSESFQRRMRQSMAVSYHKYGPVAEAYPHKVDAIASLRKRLRLYEETGNADYLVDVANFAMIEFMHPAHEAYHDKPTDGGEGRRWHAGGPASERRNNGER